MTARDLPDGWQWAKLGDLGSFKSGGTPSKKIPEFWGDSVPFVTAADLLQPTVDRTCARSFLTESGWGSGRTAQAAKGDVLVGTRTGVGRVSVATERLAASQDITVISCRTGVHPPWLARFLTARASTLSSAASGSTIQGITRKFLTDLDVPLPPVGEQVRMVRLLEDQILAADRALMAAEAQLRDLEAMQAALLRKFFPRSRSAILNRGTRWVRLGDICDWGSGGTPRRSVPEYFQGDIPWAIIADLNDGPLLTTKESLTQAGLNGSSAKLVPEGALLIAMYGSIGKLAVTSIPMATNQAIAHAIPHAEVNTWWLFWQMMADRDLLIQNGTGVAQSNISQKFLRSWQILLPSLGMQNQIMAKFEHLIVALGHGQSIAERRHQQVGAMQNALLRLAFPND